MPFLFFLLFSFMLIFFPHSVSANIRNIRSVGSTLIVGGVEARKGEFPFIVGLRKSSNHHCAGSIISPNMILTAAHCVTGDPSLFSIIAGDHINNVLEGTEQNKSVSLILIHPGYDGLNSNDIALMRVFPPFEYNEFVQPVQLAPRFFVPTLVQTVSGWGQLAEGGATSSVLMKVQVPYVTREKCMEAYGDRIKESMTCAGTGGRDACKGDSGGPLICSRLGENVLCGVVSWGTGCARPDKPGVYSKVSYFAEWIAENIS